MKSTLAIIVTYNRLDLLKECISAVLNQLTICDILIINNYSIDGTKEYLELIRNKSISILNLDKNIGGAGGFSMGVKEAILRGYKYAWLMDDDTIPESNALSSLENKAMSINGEFSFLSGFTKWTDNTLCKMNVQTISSNWENYYYRIEEGLIPISDATFVSYFINLAVAKEVGLPIKEFFIYADDWEYSIRLTKIKPAYLDTSCFVVHKMKDNVKSDISICSEERIKRCYFDLRNHYYVVRKYGSSRNKIRYILDRFSDLTHILKSKSKKKGKRIKVLIKGTMSGIFFNPKIEKV